MTKNKVVLCKDKTNFLFCLAKWTLNRFVESNFYTCVSFFIWKSKEIWSMSTNLATFCFFLTEATFLGGKRRKKSRDTKETSKNSFTVSFHEWKIRDVLDWEIFAVSQWWARGTTPTGSNEFQWKLVNFATKGSDSLEIMFFVPFTRSFPSQNVSVSCLRCSHLRAHAPSSTAECPKHLFFLKLKFSVNLFEKHNRREKQSMMRPAYLTTVTKLKATPEMWIPCGLTLPICKMLQDKNWGHAGCHFS